MDPQVVEVALVELEMAEILQLQVMEEQEKMSPFNLVLLSIMVQVAAVALKVDFPVTKVELVDKVVVEMEDQQAVEDKMVILPLDLVEVVEDTL